MMSRFAGIFATEASRRVAGCSTVASCSKGRPGSDGVTGLTAITLAPTSAMPAVIYGRRAADLAWGVAAHSFRCCATGEPSPHHFPMSSHCGSLPLENFVFTCDLNRSIEQRLYPRKHELWLHHRIISTHAKSGRISKPPTSVNNLFSFVDNDRSDNINPAEHRRTHRTNGPRKANRRPLGLGGLAVGAAFGGNGSLNPICAPTVRLHSDRARSVGQSLFLAV